MKNFLTKIISSIIVGIAFLLQTNLQAQWAKDAVAGEHGNYGYGVTVDEQGNSYIIGRFSGTADFDPSSGTTELTSVASADIYFAKYNAEGELLWVKQIGNDSYNYGYSIALDGNGGLYIAGYFKGTNVDFDPGVGTHNLSSAGSYDVFFAKYNTSDGSYVWAKNIGGEKAENAYCVEVVNGYVYLIGRFQGDADFDPDDGEVILSSGSTSFYDIFFAKYNASDGSYVWAKNIGNDDKTEYGFDLAVDANGNIYITGIFYNTMDFDPDAGTVNLTSNGDRDVFFAKYKSSDGSIIWAKNVGGADNDYGYSIAVDPDNNVYITGRFEGTSDFDPDAGTVNITSNGDYDTFIAKYNSSGSYVWAKGVGGDDKVYGYNIISDGADVYVSGNYKGTSDFGTDQNISLTSAGDYDIWFAKYSASNCSTQWAKSIGGSDIDQQQYGNSIATGSFHITGYFKSTDADFDPGSGTEIIASAGNFDVFNAKYTVDGELPVELTTFSAEVSGNTVNLTWETATEVNNYGFDVEKKFENGKWVKIAFVEGNGNSNSVKHYTYADKTTISGKYFYRLKQIDINGTSEYLKEIEVNVGVPQKFNIVQNYPNPFNPTTTISFAIPEKTNVKIVIYNSLGKKIKTLINKTLRAGVHSYNYNATGLGSGVYYYKITAGKNTKVNKMILMK